MHRIASTSINHKALIEKGAGSSRSRYYSALGVAGKEVEQDTKVNGQSTSTSQEHVDQGGRFGSLLDSVGLVGKLTHAKDLPALRTVTPNDVFCNRELKMSGIRAIGFDMDYTLAQYQQPAFDKLAFDGAKEKLVKKLGYPEEVLDFEYDHEVRLFIFCCDVICCRTTMQNLGGVETRQPTKTLHVYLFFIIILQPLISTGHEV